jgi:zinc transporter 1/2/3
MGGLYALTTPVGVVIGIAMDLSFSEPNPVVQGVFNSLAAGMLIYIGLVSLAAEEFSRTDLLARGRDLSAVTAALLFGVASMCMLGIWA